MSDVCMIFFNRDDCDKERAIDFLKNYGISVVVEEDYLAVQKANSPIFKIYLVEADFVNVEAKEISTGTAYQKNMAEFNARFEVIIENLDEALDEANTLMDVQGALQDASNGYLFTAWNGNIMEPYMV